MPTEGKRRFRTFSRSISPGDTWKGVAMSLGPIERHERNLSGWDFFLLWTGAAIALPEIWAGGLLASLGLVGGLLAILLGHLIGNTPMALGGIIGSRHGVPSIVSTRGALGPRGAFLPAALNVIQLAGWTAVMVWIGGHAAARLSPASLQYPRLWIVVCGGLTTLWALGGHRLWKTLQRFTVILLFLVSVVMTWIVVREYGWRNLAAVRPAEPGSFMLGLDLVIAMPLSWALMTSDYSRYARSTKGSFWGSWLGYFAGSCWMYAVGLCAALATQTATPDSMVLDLLHQHGLAIAALIVILLSTLTTTFLDVYSNAVSLLSVVPRLGQRAAVLLCGVAGTLCAVFFPVTEYESFLLLIGSAFSPLLGIVLADYFLVKKGSYDANGLFQRNPYWYNAGVNFRAIVAWGLGFVLCQVSSRQGWSIGASLPGMLASAGLYLVAMAWRRGNASGEAGGTA